MVRKVLKLVPSDLVLEAAVVLDDEVDAVEAVVPIPVTLVVIAGSP
jgi:hypothetical protein